jgi:hypothetical protein
MIWRTLNDVLVRQESRSAVNYSYIKQHVNVQGKAIPVTGRGGPYGCETSRLPKFLDNRLTDGGEVASLMRRPTFTPRNIPGSHFC